MTNPTPRIPAANARDTLRARIEAAERRNAERTLADQAREAASAAVDYTRAHPLTVIGGALSLGLVIGLLTRPGRRMASQVAHSTAGALTGAAASARSGVNNVTPRSGSRIGRMVGDAVVAYAMTMFDDALEAAQAGQDRASELGDAAGSRARRLASNTADAAGSAADNTRALARKTRDAAVGAARDLVRKTKG